MEEHQSEKIDKILKEHARQATSSYYENPVLLTLVVVLTGPIGIIILFWLLFKKKEIFNRILPNLLIYIGIMEGIFYSLYGGSFFLFTFPQLAGLFKEAGQEFNLPATVFYFLVPIILAISAVLYGRLLAKKSQKERERYNLLATILLFGLLIISTWSGILAARSIIMPLYNLANVT